MRFIQINWKMEGGTVVPLNVAVDKIESFRDGQAITIVRIYDCSETHNQILNLINAASGSKAATLTALGDDN